MTPSAIEAPAPAIGAQLAWVLHRIRLVAIVATSIVLGALLFEAARMLQSAAGVHPALALAGGAGIAGGLAWLFLPLWRALRLPRVVVPPKVPAGESFEPSHLAAQVAYLERYVRNCARNPELAGESAAIASASRELAELRSRFAEVDRAVLGAAREELGRFVEQRVVPFLAPIDAKVERLIHQEALSVGLGTAISPYGTLDAFVVLWRSIRMSSRIAVLYYGRPGPSGAVRVLADVALATVAASCMQSVGDSLGGLVARSLGGVAGIVAGPPTQAVTNALVMVRLGYLVQARCRSFRQWDPGTQRSALTAAFASTQRVAVGLVGEILRQAGSGLGAVAGAAFGFAREAGLKISNGLRSIF